MCKLDLVRQAVQELGEVPAADLAAFIRDKHGVAIEPPLVRIIQATLLHQEMLGKYREEAKEMVERATACSPQAS